jgi:hypothetical protein
MANIECAACGSSVAEADTYFGEVGQVCGTCHSNTELQDAERYRADNEVGTSPRHHSEMGVGMGVPDSALQHTSSHTDDKGRTVTRTFSFDAGPLTMVIKIIMAIYYKLTKR